ncbi:MAG: helix-turn-helix domain-containing protein [Actinomycetota bacterium]
MDAGRAVREARRRAGITQEELARRSGLHQPAVARIEAGTVTPRVDTLDRMLHACGITLTAEPRLGADVEREAIRELLRLKPAERLSRAAVAVRGFRPARTLQILSARAVRFVVVGEVAERLQGSPARAQVVEIVVATDGRNRRRLILAVDRLRSFRWNPTGRLRWRFTAPPGGPDYPELARAADEVEVAGKRIAVASLDDLIRIRLTARARATRERAAILWAVREERDAPL